MLTPIVKKVHEQSQVHVKHMEEEKDVPIMIAQIVRLIALSYVNHMVADHDAFTLPVKKARLIKLICVLPMVEADVALILIVKKVHEQSQVHVKHTVAVYDAPIVSHGPMHDAAQRNTMDTV